ncbi:polygalacturonase [Colletotrichum orchidophilum]|uniref:galacturonan 1,4-alpha-galacturonidase n=1 Tax=Colletotrichum orchidophilum TaxID=1209926 RepID=A0A1G4BQ49_9PEZI|nr:polygalacturonase [Colletotrichum orchidophilum]OHF03443.1 polygalacturonase [Colletotrichum orchidophilum]
MVAPTLLGGLLAAALVPLTHAAAPHPSAPHASAPHASAPHASATHAAAPLAAAPQRPNIKPAPYHPSRAFPTSPPRTKTCAVKPGTNGSDDAAAILQAFKSCNNGGTIVLDASYTICSPLDLTFLNAVDVAITGTVKFCDDIDYWLPRLFQYAFQQSVSFWKFGGKDVQIYGNGKGTIDGNGQKWYDLFATNATLQRPILFVTDGLHGGSITGLNMINSPQWFNLIANSSEILISDINIKAASSSANPAKNTDGWDIYRSDEIVIQNSHIDNGDDCVSFKPNATNIIVQGLTCIGTPHGMSVGSLGQYAGTFDIVENVLVYNTSMSNAPDAARIKVWPNFNSQFQPSLSGGGGAGYVKNITYDTFSNDNNDNAITINQCYGQKNQTLCEQYPSKVTISDVIFKNFVGTTSPKNDPGAGSLVCSSPDTCHNIRATNINVKVPSGKPPQWVCINLDNSLLQINCVTKVTKN